MALNPITLDVNVGIQNAPFRSALNGLTPGTERELDDDASAQGGIILDGVLHHPALPEAGTNTLVVKERSSVGEERETTLQISGLSRQAALLLADTALSSGRIAVSRRTIGIIQSDGSLVWSVSVTDDLGNEIVTPIGGTPTPTPTPTFTAPPVIVDNGDGTLSVTSLGTLSDSNTPSGAWFEQDDGSPVAISGAPGSGTPFNAAAYSGRFDKHIFWISAGPGGVTAQSNSVAFGPVAAITNYDFDKTNGQAVTEAYPELATLSTGDAAGIAGMKIIKQSPYATSGVLQHVSGTNGNLLLDLVGAGDSVARLCKAENGGDANGWYVIFNHVDASNYCVIEQPEIGGTYAAAYKVIDGTKNTTPIAAVQWKAGGAALALNDTYGVRYDGNNWVILCNAAERATITQAATGLENSTVVGWTANDWRYIDDWAFTKVDNALTILSCTGESASGARRYRIIGKYSGTWGGLKALVRTIHGDLVLALSDCTVVTASGGNFEVVTPTVTTDPTNNVPTRVTVRRTDNPSAKRTVTANSGLVYSAVKFGVQASTPEPSVEASVFFNDWGRHVVSYDGGNNFVVPGRGITGTGTIEVDSGASISTAGSNGLTLTPAGANTYNYAISGDYYPGNRVISYSGGTQKKLKVTRTGITAEFTSEFLSVPFGGWRDLDLGQGNWATPRNTPWTQNYIDTVVNQFYGYKAIPQDVLCRWYAALKGSDPNFFVYHVINPWIDDTTAAAEATTYKNNLPDDSAPIFLEFGNEFRWNLAFGGAMQLGIIKALEAGYYDTTGHTATYASPNAGLVVKERLPNRDDLYPQSGVNGSDPRNNGTGAAPAMSAGEVIFMNILYIEPGLTDARPGEGSFSAYIANEAISEGDNVYLASNGGKFTKLSNDFDVILGWLQAWCSVRSDEVITIWENVFGTDRFNRQIKHVIMDWSEHDASYINRIRTFKPGYDAKVKGMGAGWYINTLGLGWADNDTAWLNTATCRQRYESNIPHMQARTGHWTQAALAANKIPVFYEGNVHPQVDAYGGGGTNHIIGTRAMFASFDGKLLQYRHAKAMMEVSSGYAFVFTGWGDFWGLRDSLTASTHFREDGFKLAMAGSPEPTS